MVQIGNISKIQSVKEHLQELKQNGVVTKWELPYEELLTRLTAAIFFFNPTRQARLENIWEGLENHDGLNYRLNEEKNLSELEWRVEFNKGYER